MCVNNVWKKIPVCVSDSVALLQLSSNSIMLGLVDSIMVGITSCIIFYRLIGSIMIGGYVEDWEF